ncbi:MAG: hypothetical protein QM758_11075 [Armatimonas sp.]
MTNDEMIELVRKSAADLSEATLGLGDKATWSVMDKGRSAADQVAECALISGFAAGILTEKTCPPLDGFSTAKAALAAAPELALEKLAENTETLAGAIGGLTSDDHTASVAMPWGNEMTLPEVAMLVHWNNSYHLGQVNFISTLV